MVAMENYSAKAFSGRLLIAIVAVAAIAVFMFAWLGSSNAKPAQTPDYVLLQQLGNQTNMLYGLPARSLPQQSYFTATAENHSLNYTWLDSEYGMNFTREFSPKANPVNVTVPSGLAGMESPFMEFQAGFTGNQLLMLGEYYNFIDFITNNTSNCQRGQCGQSPITNFTYLDGPAIGTSPAVPAGDTIAPQGRNLSIWYSYTQFGMKTDGVVFLYRNFTVLLQLYGTQSLSQSYLNSTAMHLYSYLSSKA